MSEKPVVYSDAAESPLKNVNYAPRRKLKVIYDTLYVETPEEADKSVKELLAKVEAVEKRRFSNNAREERIMNRNLLCLLKIIFSSHKKKHN